MRGFKKKDITFTCTYCKESFTGKFSLAKTTCSDCKGELRKQWRVNKKLAH